MPIASSQFAGVRGAEQKHLGDVQWGLRSSLLLEPLSIKYPSASPEGVESSVIDGSLLFELGMNVGIGAGFDAGLRMGATLAQWGPGVSVGSGTNDEIASFGATDPALELGWTAELTVLSVRPFAALRIPWGRQDAFSGDSHARGEWGVASAGKFWKVEWGGEVGFLYRAIMDVSGSTWGSQLRIGGGMMIRITDTFRLGPELHLHPVIAPQKNRSGESTGFLLPAEGLLTAHYTKSNWDLGGSLGTGLPLSSTGTADTSLTRGPTSPLLRFMLQLSMNLENSFPQSTQQ